MPDKTIRHRVSRGLNTDEVAEPNVFALTAPIAAFTKGGAWLDELRAYLWENRKTAEAFIKEEIPQISVVAAEATYLLWIDCTRIAKKKTTSAHLSAATAGCICVTARNTAMATAF